MKKLIITILLFIVGIQQPVIKKVYIDKFKFFTEENLRRFIFLIGIEHPEIVYAQAQIESGNFSSPIFIEGNNLFGMKRAERRASVAISTHRGHAQYSSLQYSVIDYSLMQARYAKGKTRKQYLTYLQNYAEDPTYITKIKRKL